MKSIKRVIFLLLAVAALLSLFGCQTPTAEHEEPAHTSQVQQEQAGDELSSLFTYDDANALRLDVKTDLPQGKKPTNILGAIMTTQLNCPKRARVLPTARRTP